LTDLPPSKAPSPDAPAADAAVIRSALDAVAAALVIVDARRRIVRANPAAARLLRRRPQTLDGQPAADLAGPSEAARLDRLIDRCIARRRGGRFGLKLTGGDGTPLEIAADATVFEAPSGAGAHLAVSLTDIGPRRRMEAEWRSAGERASRASRAKTAFLANVSHELRTPLNAILGFTDILRLELFGPLGTDRYRGYARDIHDSAAHLLALVDDLLDLSKIEAGATVLDEATVDVPILLGDVARMLEGQAAARGIVLEHETQDGLPPVRADRRMLRQVLLNLLGNAIKYSDAEERVGLSALRLADGGLAIVVSDTGIGIAVADQERALRPYGRIGPRLDSRGAGLGLPLAKALIERHGGRLFLNSDVGAGTSIFVTLPADRVIDTGDDPLRTFTEPQPMLQAVGGLTVARFVGREMDEIESLKAEDLDRLPVGAIKLDATGRVLSYNATESRFSGLSPRAVLGRDFFRDIAPCTAGSVFEQTFRDGMARGKLDALLEYVFSFPGRPMRVAVHMRTGREPGVAWLFVRWI